MPYLINLRLALVAIGVVLVGCSSSTAMQSKVSAIDPQAVTPCDEIAAHPSDPLKVSQGHATKDIDLPKAVAICREAVPRTTQQPAPELSTGSSADLLKRY